MDIAKRGRESRGEGVAQCTDTGKRFVNEGMVQLAYRQIAVILVKKPYTSIIIMICNDARGIYTVTAGFKVFLVKTDQAKFPPKGRPS